MLVFLAALERLRLLLRHTDEDHAFRLVKALPILGGDVVLALARLKVHDGNAALLGQGLNLGLEVVGDPTQQGGRRDLVPPMADQEVDQLPRHLQGRNVAVEIDAIQTLDGQRHVIAQQVVDVRHRPASNG